MKNKLYQYYVGIGNFFIKTPFYSTEKEYEDKPIRKIDTSTWARPEGIHPSEIFGDSNNRQKNDRP